MYACVHTHQLHPGRKDSYLESYFFYHIYGERKKNEAYSFSLWLKKNTSAGQGLIVTIILKYCPIVWVLLFLWWFSCEKEMCCDPLNGLSITPTDLSVQEDWDHQTLAAGSICVSTAWPLNFPRITPCCGTAWKRGMRPQCQPALEVGMHALARTVLRTNCFLHQKQAGHCSRAEESTPSWNSWWGPAEAFGKRPHLCEKDDSSPVSPVSILFPLLPDRAVTRGRNQGYIHP